MSCDDAAMDGFARFFSHILPCRRLYLDCASATPLHPSVARAMAPYMGRHFGNPGALHREGVVAHAALETSRRALSRILSIREDGIVFTSGGTESNNLALFGVIEARRQAGVPYADMELITTAVEHPSVRAAVCALRARGVVVRCAAVDGEGRVRVREFAKLLSARTVLVSMAYVNSEIGTVQPVRALARAVRAAQRAHATRILFHLDAAQAPLWLPCALPPLDVDLLSLDAAKCEGPKGAGVLAKAHGVEIAPSLVGGGQQWGLRSGTENVPLIVGAARALVRAQEGYAARARSARAASRALVAALEAHLPCVVQNGPRDFEKKRVAHNVNISLPGVDTEYAAVVLDRAGIAVATKSTCNGARAAGSEVVRVISGGDEARARSTLRFTHNGRLSSADCRRVARTLSRHVAQMRPYTAYRGLQMQASMTGD